MNSNANVFCNFNFSATNQQEYPFSGISLSDQSMLWLKRFVWHAQRLMVAWHFISFFLCSRKHMLLGCHCWKEPANRCARVLLTVVPLKRNCVSLSRTLNDLSSPDQVHKSLSKLELHFTMSCWTSLSANTSKNIWEIDQDQKNYGAKTMEPPVLFTYNFALPLVIMMPLVWWSCSVNHFATCLVRYNMNYHGSLLYAKEEFAWSAKFVGTCYSETAEFQTSFLVYQ